MLDMAGVTPSGRLLARATGETGRVARGILPLLLVSWLGGSSGPDGLGDPSGQRHFGHFGGKGVRWPLPLSGQYHPGRFNRLSALLFQRVKTSCQKSRASFQKSRWLHSSRWIFSSSVLQKSIFLLPVWLSSDLHLE